MTAKKIASKTVKPLDSRIVRRGTIFCVELKVVGAVWVTVDISESYTRALWVKDNLGQVGEVIDGQKTT